MFTRTQQKLDQLARRTTELEIELDSLLERFAVLVERLGGRVTFSAADLPAGGTLRRDRLARLDVAPDVEEWRLE